MGGNRSAGSVAPAIERGPTGTQRSLTTDDHEREGLSRLIRPLRQAPFQSKNATVA